MKEPKEKHPLAHFLAEHVFDGKPNDRNHAIDVYTRHIDEVIATVSKDRLLIHKLGDGWETPCEHLGVPVPEENYPNQNATNEFLTK